MTDPIPNPAVLADIAEQDARAVYIDALYYLDGRNKPDHPMNGLYTGLFLARRDALVKRDRHAWRNWTL